MRVSLVIFLDCILKLVCRNPLAALHAHLASSSRRVSVTPVRIPLAASELTAAASAFILAAAEAAWLMAAVGGRPTTQGLGLPEARCRDLHEGDACSEFSITGGT